MDVSESVVDSAVCVVVVELVVTSAIVVVVEDAGANVVAVRVACVSAKAPGTESQIWYTSVFFLIFSEHKAYTQVNAASPMVRLLGVFERHKHLIFDLLLHVVVVYSVWMKFSVHF